MPPTPSAPLSLCRRLLGLMMKRPLLRRLRRRHLVSLSQAPPASLPPVAGWMGWEPIGAFSIIFIFVRKRPVSSSCRISLEDFETCS